VNAIMYNFQKQRYELISKAHKTALHQQAMLEKRRRWSWGVG